MDVGNSLFDAVRESNLERVKEIIDSYGISYSKSWAMGYALLQISVKNKHMEITKLLLASGAKVNNSNKRNKLKESPLHLAASFGLPDIVKMLLDKGANMNAKNQFGATVFQTAVFRNRSDVMELLLSRGASPNERKSDGSSCLHIAVERGNVKATEMLLKYKANVNVISNSFQRNSQTPLHIAAEKGNYRIVELLLKNGAFINAKAKGGLTPIFFAIKHRRHKIIKQLLDHGANVDMQNDLGVTILFLAVEQASLKMVELILEYKPDLNNTMNRNSLNVAICGDKASYKLIVKNLLEYGFTYDPDYRLLKESVEKGYTQIVENCLKYSVNTFLMNIPSKSFSLIHVAVKKKGYEITEMLINYGANVNALDDKNKSPLYYATQNGDIVMLKLLLSKGATLGSCSGLIINAVKDENIEMVYLLLKHKVNVREVDAEGKTALHYSALNMQDSAYDSVLFMNSIPPRLEKSRAQNTAINCKIAKVLLTAGADINAQCNEGKSALHFACFKGNSKLVELFFEHNAKMFPDKTGAFPIHYSANGGNVDVLKILINKEADINAKSTNGSTTLHFGAHDNHIEYMEYLLSYGAKIDEKDKNGLTPLHIAAQNDHLELVELLLKYGADINATDKSGRSAFNMVTNEGNSRIIRVLLNYGIDINRNKKNLTPYESALLMGVEMFQNLFNHFGSENNDYDDDENDDSDYNYLDYDSDYNGYYGSENDFINSGLYYPGQEIMSGSEIAELVQQHVMMMKAANLKLDDDDSPTHTTSKKLLEFKLQCEKEVERLKSSEICSNSNVTFYDILSKPIENIAMYVRNPKIAEVLKSNQYKIKFPTYYGMINGKFVRGYNRKDMLEQGNLFFDMLSENLSIMLPYNCRDNIFTYLSDNDVRVLVKAITFDK